MHFATRKPKNRRGYAQPIAQDEVHGYLKDGRRVDRSQYPFGYLCCRNRWHVVVRAFGVGIEKCAAACAIQPDQSAELGRPHEP